MKARFRRLVAALFERQVRRVIKRHHLRVVAVAGSVGKTSTKTAISTVLSQKYRVLVHPGNYNSEIGLPLSVFELAVPATLFNPFAWAVKLVQSEFRLRHYPYQVLVLELGTDHPGEIPRYLRYLSPTVGVITAVTPEHMENFPGGLSQVAEEELALVGASKTVVAGYDNILPAHRHQYIDPHPYHTYFGAQASAGARFKILSTEPMAGSTVQISQKGESPLQFTAPIFGEPLARAATAAFVVGRQLGLTPTQVAAGLAAVRPVPGRMSPFAGQNGSVVIDDTYNSSPEAVEAALSSLYALKLPPNGRRIAVLGAMNELGPQSPQYHAQVGKVAAGLDWLITLGPDANAHLGPAAVAAGLDPSRWQSATSPYAAGEFVRALLHPGDVVLAKGSQNRVFAEESVRLLLANPADAAHLVRQGASWQRMKRRQFPDYPVS